MSANLLPNLIQQFRDANGDPLVGGKLYSYRAGTNTPLSTFTDQTQDTSNANPTILDANGEASIWIGALGYKFILKDANGSTLHTVDNVKWINDGYITADMIAAGEIGTLLIADLSITTAKLADGAVTNPKIADGAIDTPKLEDESVTLAKLDPTILQLDNLGDKIEVVFKNIGDYSSIGGIVGTPQFPWSSPSKLVDPSSLPSDSQLNDVAWSPNGEFLAAAQVVSPRVALYQRSGTTFIKLGDPANLPPGPLNSVAWSPNGKFLAVASSTSPYIVIYQRFGSTFLKLTDPVDLPAGVAIGVAWSANSQFLSVTHATSPYVTIYQVNVEVLAGTLTGVVTGTIVDVPNPVTTASTNLALKELQTVLNKSPFAIFTKLSDPANLPAGQGNRSAWSSTGRFLAVAHNTTPFVTIYDRSGSTFTKLADPGTLPPTSGLSVAWSPNEQYLAVGSSSTPYVTIYQRSGTTFTKVSDPASLPTGTVSSLAWSPNSKYLSLAVQASPYVAVYDRSGTTFTKLADPSTLPTGTGRGIAWSHNGEFLAVAHSTSPLITIYQTASTLPSNAILWAREITNV